MNRKKLLWTVLVLAGMLPTRAEEYGYLTFELTDGAKASVSVESLTLTFEGATLKVGQETFKVSNLSKMYFSTTDETTGTPDAIDDVKTDDGAWDDGEIYDLNGRRVTRDQMRKGVYIVKTKERTCKIVVK
ncbi:MAG: hypothetical protein J6T00_01965 [Bacteroidaceae bacterium]|nr:hypothetical protein [Bacteroidaceae bacterium]